VATQRQVVISTAYPRRQLVAVMRAGGVARRALDIHCPLTSTCLGGSTTPVKSWWRALCVRRWLSSVSSCLLPAFCTRGIWSTEGWGWRPCGWRPSRESRSAGDRPGSRKW